MEDKNTLDKPNIETLCITAGNKPDHQTGAICVPITLSTTFEQYLPGQHKGFEYGRTGNPTRKALEECIAKLEDGDYGYAFSSGSAVTSTILHLLNTGDHIISSDDVYGGTFRYFDKVLSRCNNIQTTFIDLNDIDLFIKSILPNTKMVWIETPTNPTLKIVDIQKISKVAKERGIIVVVDNTFATPYLQKPLNLGADIVAHSATKYINGHSDVVIGLIVTKSEEFSEKIKFLQNSVGSVPSPFDCYLTLRGIKTLCIRMKRQCKNAKSVAKYLSKHEKVQTVYYPGLQTHSNHSIAVKQMKLFGAMVSFCLVGGKQEVFRFMDKLRYFKVAESLGCVKSLANYPSVMTHAAVPEEIRISLGITSSMVRLSIGIESKEDLIKDLEKALENV